MGQQRRGQGRGRAAWDKTKALGLGTRAVDMADVGAIVYAAYLAAGWDAEPGEPREHVHAWEVRNSADGISFNPTGGPSVGVTQTIVLLRCDGCGDVASRILTGRWTLEDLRDTPLA